ncbi:MAG TPA: hypothetical protein VGK78_04745 [Nocardioides sp.]|uniref:hypothetical protein n=1 Tax=Nocardioides sp. TaxID=35761 RepID=UPI002F40B6D7
MSPTPRRKRIPPRTPRQQQTRMARRLERHPKKSDDLDVDAVLQSAAEAVRQAWGEHEETR